MESPPTANPQTPRSQLQRLTTAILEARTQRQMSRGALAEQAGVALQAVEDLERGYPVPHDILVAICRNLDVSVPPLESNPLIRLALLLRERRGLARLSRSMLAAKSGLTTKILHALEAASLWPNQAICLALLSVNALQLHESDVAAFIHLPSAQDAESGPHQHADRAPESPAAANESREPSSSSPRTRGRPALSRSAGPARALRDPADTKALATFLVRFYANGKVSIEMRPNLPKRNR